MTIKTTGILLSGGKNSRMGVNKAFIDVDGGRLIDKTLYVYRQIFEEIIIVTNDPTAYLEFDCAIVVTDIYPGKGPLGGIYTGLFYASHPYAFVTACDLPFLNADFIRYLIGRSGRHDIIVPKRAQGPEPLFAIYSRDCLPSISRLLLMDRLKITGFYRDMNVLDVTEDEIAPFNPEGKLFLNLNTPDDIKQIHHPIIEGGQT